MGFCGIMANFRGIKKTIICLEIMVFFDYQDLLKNEAKIEALHLIILLNLAFLQILIILMN